MTSRPIRPGARASVGCCVARWSPHAGAAAQAAARSSRRRLTVCAVPAVDAPDRQGAGRHAQGSTSPWRSTWAAVLGRTIEFHWCASAECAWNCLPEGRCDVVLGQPHDSGPPREVAWSVPYAGGQFGLVVPRDAHGRPFPGRPPRQAGRDRGRHGGPLGEGPRGGPVQDARGAARRVRGRGARRRVPRRRLRRLVPARAPAARPAARGRVRARASTGTWPWPCAPGCAAPGGDQPGPGPARRVGRAPEDLCRARRAVPSAVHGDRPQAGSRRHLAAHPRRGELVVSMDPANLPYSSAKDDRPGFDVELARALAERLRRQAADRMARRPARDRGRANCSSASATSSSARPSTPTPSPTTKSWRERSSTRGPTTAPATCSCGARTARASSRWPS